jgi:hypothetical protein
MYCDTFNVVQCTMYYGDLYCGAENYGDFTMVHRSMLKFTTAIDTVVQSQWYHVL